MTNDGGSLLAPSNLARTAAAEGRLDWVERLPPIIADLTARWSLTVGEPYEPGGHTAWVAPAHSATHGPVVLKLAWRHPEMEDEVEALREWDGDGAVRIHGADSRDDTVAMLLERCEPGHALCTRHESEHDAVVATLLSRLWREPSPRHAFRSLQVMCDQWADQYVQKLERGQPPISMALAREGIRLFRELPATAARTVLLCTDLHAGNVLAAQREPWLAIDPKPYVGDPTYDALQHMLNCGERLHADPAAFARHLADLLGLDDQRLLLWLFARCVIESADWPELGHVARRLAPS